MPVRAIGEAEKLQLRNAYEVQETGAIVDFERRECGEEYLGGGIEVPSDVAESQRVELSRGYDDPTSDVEWEIFEGKDGELGCD